MQRSLVSLAVGVVLAVIAVVFLNYYFESANRPPPRPATVALTTVVVAARDLPLGSQLHEDLVKAIPWPASSVPQGSFRTVADIFHGEDSAGRVTLRQIDTDEPILRTTITGFGGRPTLSHEVSPGMRAVSIRIDDVSGVAGFVLPGDRVDIMLTRRNNSEAGDTLVTDTILQNVTVLGIDQSSDQARDQPVVARTATVEVTPDEAQKLVLAQQAGTLSLALRNVVNTQQIPTASINTKDLVPAERLQDSPRSGTSIRIVYGDGTVVTRTVR